MLGFFSSSAMTVSIIIVSFHRVHYFILSFAVYTISALLIPSHGSLFDILGIYYAFSFSSFVIMSTSPSSIILSNMPQFFIVFVHYPNISDDLVKRYPLDLIALGLKPDLLWMFMFLFVFTTPLL